MSAPVSSRRGFLQGFLALAALAVAGPSLSAISPDDRARLLASAASGLVEHQHFLLREPVALDIEGLTLRHCTFHFDFSAPASHGIWFKTQEEFLIEKSNFYVLEGSTAPDCVLYIGPRGAVIGNNIGYGVRRIPA